MKTTSVFKYALTVLFVGAFSFKAFTQTSTKAISTSEVNSAPGKHSMGVGLGQTFLMGDFSSNGDDSITTDIFYSYNASRTFDLLISGHVSDHQVQNKDVRLMALTTSIKSRVFDFDSFSPFILGGLGFYRPKVTRDVGNGLTKGSNGKYTFGINFGGGADLKLNERYTMGILGILHKPFKIKQDDQADVSGTYFKLLLTLMYAF